MKQVSHLKPPHQLLNSLRSKMRTMPTLFHQACDPHYVCCCAESQQGEEGDEGKVGGERHCGRKRGDCMIESFQ